MKFNLQISVKLDFLYALKIKIVKSNKHYNHFIYVSFINNPEMNYFKNLSSRQKIDLFIPVEQIYSQHILIGNNFIFSESIVDNQKFF